ncbi:fibrocystin-L-like [Erpetoichthys calabaricus]|uniref:fibrocystin-L-like n=1 Tax=Erpetoichthys calabaricus TaxID=27687 RepID=UPI002233FE60|nr:fibrocystin-L-like [Erpetoichthys calabaricus]
MDYGVLDLKDYILTGTGLSQGCDVTVYNGNNLVTLSNAFTYTSSLTPVVTAVTPRRGGTGGGTKLTITGSGFGSDIDNVMVTIARTPCNVTYVNEMEIICITDAQPQSQRTKVKVNVGGTGIAKLMSTSPCPPALLGKYKTP